MDEINTKKQRRHACQLTTFIVTVPEPKALKTTPTPEPHAQLVGLQFHMTVLTLTLHQEIHNCNPYLHIFVNASQITASFSAAVVDLGALKTVAEGEAVQQGDNMAVGLLEPGVLRHD